MPGEHTDATERPAATQPWWRDAVIYQIYPRSFADSDGDGIGDLGGVREHLAEVSDLGVDALWLNPFYPSPQRDGGYDVVDHRDVDPLFGTLADLDSLLDEAHTLGLRVLLDLVPNHTSSEHVWFHSALASEPGSTERARYLFRPGRGAGGDEPPNDWQSVFGGPAWTRVTEPDGSAGEWYLHLFAPEQPDLDWMNPEVRAEFESILRFWLERGVDGFRIDVAHGLAKDAEMSDLAGRFQTSGLAEAGHPHWDQDEVHEVFRSWRRIGDEYPGDRMFVAEAYLRSPGRLARYVRPDELHTAFNFGFLMAPWDATELRDAIDRSIDSHAEVGAVPTWVLSNHDVVRHVTRYGGGAIGRKRARAAALLMLALPGSAYIYQGEELGLPEVVDLPDDVLQDPTFTRTGGRERGRDGCRVPLPWTADAPAFGFSPTGASWLPQPADWDVLARDRQAAQPDSMLQLYRDALRLRAERLSRSPTADARLQWVDLLGDAWGPDVLAFRRGPNLTCVVNLGERSIALARDARGQDVRILLASETLGDSHELPADTAVWIT